VKGSVKGETRQLVRKGDASRLGLLLGDLIGDGDVAQVMSLSEAGGLGHGFCRKTENVGELVLPPKLAVETFHFFLVGKENGHFGGGWGFVF
jgi:hypothetical protein